MPKQLCLGGSKDALRACAYAERFGSELQRDFMMKMIMILDLPGMPWSHAEHESAGPLRVWRGVWLAADAGMHVLMCYCSTVQRTP
jgi:hypothetical protein